MRQFRIGLLLTLYLPLRVSAFTSNGHDIIEAMAYRRLLARANITRLSNMVGRPFSGKDALDALISYRILDRPHDWPNGNSNDPLMSLPIVRSGNLDYILSRQFEGNSQCFHFMARASDVYWDTTTDPTYGYPHMLYDSAYPRCIAFMTSMYHVILGNALAAWAGDHDVYGLMHCIADSYSAAHVDRDSNWQIIYLKVWEPTAVIPYFFHPAAERFFDGPWGHKFSDSRDDDYWDNAVTDPTCSSAVNPYEVDWDCLSPRAIQAVKATEELLIVLTENVLTQTRERHIDTAFQQWTWKQYLATYFVGWKGVAPSRRLRADEREWRPLIHLGVDYHSTTVNNSIDRDYTATLNADAPIGALGPVTPGFLVNYGIREYPDHTIAPVLRAGYSLSFDFADDFQLRMTPFEREFVFTKQHRGETRNLVSIVQLEGIVDRHFWFRLEAPRFWTSGWLANDYGVSVGWSDGWDIGTWLSLRFRTGKAMPLAGSRWHVPDSAEIRNSQLGTRMSISITPLHYEFNSYANHLLGLSGQLIWDRNRSGERQKGFASGLELDLSEDAEEFQSLEAGYILRYYLTPHFAVTSEPANFVVSLDGAEPHPSGPLTWDAESTLGVMALLSHSDLTVGLARISWRDALHHASPFYMDLPAGFRIGANFFIP